MNQVILTVLEARLDQVGQNYLVALVILMDLAIQHPPVTQWAPSDQLVLEYQVFQKDLTALADLNLQSGQVTLLVQERPADLDHQRGPVALLVQVALLGQDLLRHQHHLWLQQHQLHLLTLQNRPALSVQVNH